MTEERRAINEVRDRPAETSVRLLVGVTTLAVALLAYFGDRFITGQDKLIHETSQINTNMQVHTNKISRLEADVKEVRDASSNNTQEIIKLKGKHDGR